MNNRQYHVKYQTKPNHIGFYQGTVQVWADNDDEAGERALRELGRDFPVSLIRITSITRAI